MQLDIHNQLNIKIEDLVAQRCAVLGASGSGKSNTVAVLVEEVAAHMPFIIVDPHSEYWGLRQQLNILIVGKSENVDLEIDAAQARAIAEYVYSNGLSVILDLLLMDEDERAAFVLAFFGRLWELGIRQKKTFGIVLEEAHNFIPEGVKNSPVKKLMTRFALEGRKFGFGMILSTQTTVEISKTVLRQVGLLFLHRVHHMSDIKIYQQIIPGADTSSVKDIVQAMPQGEAIVVNGGQRQIVTIRKRNTFHVGATPELGSEPPRLHAIAEQLLAELRQLMQIESQSDPVKLQTQRHDDGELLRELADLRGQLAERDRLIAELRQQLAAQPVMAVAAIETVEQFPEPIPELIEDEYRTPLATTRAIKRQERAFVALIEDIGKLSPMHRILFRYLLEREGKKFTVKEMARFNGYLERTIKNSPPLPLIKMGLIKRVNGLHWATARELAQRDFPDLDEDDLIQRLLKGA